MTRGPGPTNASIGVHTAFQEVDYLSFFGPSTKDFAKRVERIDDARRIPEYVARAFATAMNGRPGPVVLVLPEDMLTQVVADRSWRWRLDGACRAGPAAFCRKLEAAGRQRVSFSGHL